MSYIPDCRVDGYYNERYLSRLDKHYVMGYDTATEQVETFFDNLDVYKEEFNINGEDINLTTFLDNHKKIKQTLIDCLGHWLEMERNEIITSIIDGMDEDVYDGNVARAERGIE